MEPLCTCVSCALGNAGGELCRESELGCPAAQISRLASLQFTLGTVEIMEGRVRCMGMEVGDRARHILWVIGGQSHM